MNKQQKTGLLLIIIGGLILLNQFQIFDLSAKNIVAVTSLLLGMLLLKKSLTSPERKGLLGGSFFLIWGIMLLFFNFNSEMGRTLFFGQLFLSLGLANLIYFLFSGVTRATNFFVFVLFAAIGGTIGSSIGQFLKVSSREMKVLVSSGVAAGIAATFNAPIAGVFFAFEIVMLGNYELTNFAPVVIASALGTVATRVLLGAEPAFTIPPYHLASFWEIPLYIILGFISAPLGVYFIRLFYFTADMFEKISIPSLFKPALGGLLVGIIGIGFPQVFGNGYEFAQIALFGGMGWALLLGLFIFKMLATSITLGSGGAGGVFAPLIYIGIMLGGVYGYAAHALFPGFTATPQVYALVGMGAFLAATTHAPLTGLFLLFELTGDYQIIIPGMIACIIGTVTAHILQPDSIDTLQLTRQGINLHQGRDINILKTIPVMEVMIKEMEPLPENLPLQQILERAKESVQSYFPVLSQSGELLGVISLRDIRPLLMEEELMNLIIAKDIVDENFLYLTPEDNLDTAMKRFAQKDLGQLPVVAAANNKELVGMIKRTDVINAYNNAILKQEME